MFLSRLDAERAHSLAAATLGRVTAVPGARSILRKLLSPRSSVIGVRAMGLDFPSPLGLAAGFDKDATWYESLALLGFGYVEVGTVTAQAQPGRPRPRVFRLAAERAVLNRMGFPNPGAEAVKTKLQNRQDRTIVGVNIGKSATAASAAINADYERSIQCLAPFSDYVVVNVSSPNTPGLRGLQSKDRLRSLLTCAQQAIADAGRNLPLLVKIGPDLSDEEIDSIAELAVEIGLDGIVAVNTTVDPTCVDADLSQFGDDHLGGISGAPLKGRALYVLRRLRWRVGSQVTLIAVGGIESPEDAWERIVAGASLLQAHTGFVYGGPLWPHRMNRGIERAMRSAGMSSIAEAVGSERSIFPNEASGTPNVATTEAYALSMGNEPRAV